MLSLSQISTSVRKGNAVLTHDSVSMSSPHTIVSAKLVLSSTWQHMGMDLAVQVRKIVHEDMKVVGVRMKSKV